MGRRGEEAPMNHTIPTWELYTYGHEVMAHKTLMIGEL